MKRCVMAVVLLLGGLSLGAAGKDPAYREARHSGALTRIELHIADDDLIVGVLYGERQNLSANYKTINTTYPVYCGA